MTQSSGTVELTFTVRTADGFANDHKYLYGYPFSDKDRETIRDIVRTIRSAFQEPPAGCIHLSRPSALYRSSQVISVVATYRTVGEVLPVEKSREQKLEERVTGLETLVDLLIRDEKSTEPRIG